MRSSFTRPALPVLYHIQPHVWESPPNAHGAVPCPWYAFCILFVQTEALNESIRLQHSTYDLFYFVLARRTGTTLFTLNRNLMRLCDQNSVNWIQETDLS